jgi:hypothetical protein
MRCIRTGGQVGYRVSTGSLSGFPAQEERRTKRLRNNDWHIIANERKQDHGLVKNLKSSLEIHCRMAMEALLSRPLTNSSDLMIFTAGSPFKQEHFGYNLITHQRPGCHSHSPFAASFDD